MKVRLFIFLRMVCGQHEEQRSALAEHLDWTDQSVVTVIAGIRIVLETEHRVKWTLHNIHLSESETACVILNY